MPYKEDKEHQTEEDVKKNEDMFNKLQMLEEIKKKQAINKRRSLELDNNSFVDLLKQQNTIYEKKEEVIKEPVPEKPTIDLKRASTKMDIPSIFGKGAPMQTVTLR